MKPSPASFAQVLFYRFQCAAAQAARTAPLSDRVAAKTAATAEMIARKAYLAACPNSSGYLNR